MSLISLHSCEIEQLIWIYSKIIEDIIDLTRNLTHSYSIFDSSLENKITIYEFIKRIHKYTEIEPYVLMASLMYIDRFSEYNPDLIINSNNCFNLILASIILSIKQHDDLVITNKYFAKICEINTEKLLNITFIFFKMIKFFTFITEEQFIQYKQKIEKYNEHKMYLMKTMDKKEKQTVSLYKSQSLSPANFYF